MFSRGSSTSVTESVEVGEIRRPCGAAGLQTAVEVDEHMVITASIGGSGALQTGAAAKEKPMPECLLKSTEAISSSRLYSNTQTHRHTKKAEQREKRKDWNSWERTKRKEIPLGTDTALTRDWKQTQAKASMLCITTSGNDSICQTWRKQICLGDLTPASKT